MEIEDLGLPPHELQEDTLRFPRAVLKIGIRPFVMARGFVWFPFRSKPKRESPFEKMWLSLSRELQNGWLPLILGHPFETTPRSKECDSFMSGPQGSTGEIRDPFTGDAHLRHLSPTSHLQAQS